MRQRLGEQALLEHLVAHAVLVLVRTVAADDARPLSQQALALAVELVLKRCVALAELSRAWVLSGRRCVGRPARRWARLARSRVLPQDLHRSAQLIQGAG